MFCLRSYNRFLVKGNGRYVWENFDNHRWSSDFVNLVLFKTREEAMECAEKHNDVYNGWPEEINPETWIHRGICEDIDRQIVNKHISEFLKNDTST